MFYAFFQPAFGAQSSRVKSASAHARSTKCTHFQLPGVKSNFISIPRLHIRSQILDYRTLRPNLYWKNAKDTPVI